jgi:hypothetical protein
MNAVVDTAKGFAMLTAGLLATPLLAFTVWGVAIYQYYFGDTAE